MLDKFAIERRSKFEPCSISIVEYTCNVYKWLKIPAVSVDWWQASPVCLDTDGWWCSWEFSSVDVQFAKFQAFYIFRAGIERISAYFYDSDKIGFFGHENPKRIVICLWFIYITDFTRALQEWIPVILNVFIVEIRSKITRDYFRYFRV